MKLLLLLTFCLTTAFGQGPTIVTREDIRKTLQHMQALAKEQAAELDAAKTALQETQVQLGQAQLEGAAADKHVTELDGQIAALKLWGEQQMQRADTAEAQVAKDKVQLARFSKLVRWIAFGAALAAALYAFEALKPTGLLGAALSITGPGIQYGAPIAVFVIVFGAVEVYLRCFL